MRVDIETGAPDTAPTIYDDPQFDASRAFDHEDLDHTAHHAINRAVGKLKSVSEIEVVIGHAQRELTELAHSVNWTVYRQYASHMRAPTVDEATAVLKAYSITTPAKKCRELRELLKKLAQSLDVARQSAWDNMHARARADDEAELRAAFEAHEAQEKERRFDEWRAGR